MKKLLLLLTLLGISGTSLAIDTKGKYLTYPTGNFTCNELLQDNATGAIRYTDAGVFIPDALAAYVGYIDGYLTAVNRTVAGKRDHFNEVLEKDVLAWSVSYCQENPNDNFNRAIHTYVDQVLSPKVRKLGPIEN